MREFTFYSNYLPQTLSYSKFNWKNSKQLLSLLSRQLKNRLICILDFARINVNQKKESMLLQRGEDKKKKKQTDLADTFLRKSIFTAKTYAHSQTNSLSPSNSRGYHVILSRNIGQT